MIILGNFEENIVKIKIPAKVDVTIPASINFEIEASSKEEAQQKLKKYLADPFSLDSRQVNADFNSMDVADAVGETIFYESKGSSGGLKNLKVGDDEAREAIEEAFAGGENE